MILPMTKYSFLVYHKDYQDFLLKVREVGVLHLIEKQKEVSDAILERYDEIRQVGSVIKTLEKRLKEVPSPGNAAISREDGKLAYQEALTLLESLETKTQQLHQLEKEMIQVGHWGDYSTQTLENLRQNGIHLKFFTVSARKFKQEWLKEYPIAILSQHAGLIYFVQVYRKGEESLIDAEEMRPPEKPLSELMHYRDALSGDIAGMNASLDELANYRLDHVREHHKAIQEDIDYRKVLENTGKEADEKVMLLEGWVPEEKTEELHSYLEQENILFVSSKPGKDEKPPVLLKNKSFSKKFELLGELYSLPKYGELDLTPFFAPFYVLFFGFCLGDAGYGLLMAALAIILKKKVQKQLRMVLSLVFYLGLSTIFFGIIGGTAFGIPLYETNLPVYSSLASNFETRGTDINQLLFYLALVLGGVQILFGMFLKAINEIRQFGWGFAVGTIGWILLLVGSIAVYLAGNFAGMPENTTKVLQYVVLGVSGIMILPLNNLARNPLINVGAGLWNTYNMITGILGDLLSYIRLFALGISSAIMGFVFNSLAVEMSGNIPVLSVLIMIVILVIGHGINIFMSGLGAFVHPLRLTFVEFYKNAGFSGGGKQYNPFRKIN